MNPTHKINSREKITTKIKELYSEDLSEKEAQEATNNFIGFCKVAMEVLNQRNTE